MKSADSVSRLSLAVLLFGVAIAGVLLSPYGTTSLAFRRALEAQAVLVLGFTLTPIIGWWLSPRPRRPLTTSPAPVNLGIVLYICAALLGTLVGLLHGNEPRLIGGQLLSMILLPLGFVAAQTVDPRPRLTTFVCVLIGCTVAACAIHFAYWAGRLRLGFPEERLYLPNAISMAGLVLVALLLAISLVLGLDGRRRTLAVATALVMSVYLVGTGTRSLWVAAALGVVSFFLIELSVGPKSKPLALTVVAVASLAILCGGAILLTRRIPCEKVLPPEAFAGPLWRAPQGGAVIGSGPGEAAELVLPPRPGSRRTRDKLSNPVLLDERLLFLASAEAYGSGDGSATVDFVFSSPSGDALRIVSLPFRAEGGWVANEKLIQRIPKDAHQIHVSVVREPADSTEWRIRRVRLEHFQSKLPSPLAYQLIALGRRVFGSREEYSTENTPHTSSLDYRVRETKRLWDVFLGSSAAEKMVGHGLGARFTFQAPSYDSLGHRVLITNPNYIHNFYAFLMYKLGIVGTGLVFVAIGSWIGWAVRCLALLRGTVAVHTVAAYTATWLAYLAWALFCPELIDFRVAPVVGMLVGSIGTCAAPPRWIEDPKVAPSR